MYRLGHPSIRKRKKRNSVLFVVVVALVVCGLVLFVLKSFMSGSSEEPFQPQSITREYPRQNQNTDKTFTQGGFSVTLPNDWVLKEHTSTPYESFSWQAGKKGADNRWLTIYVDTMPTSMAFNRLQPVSIANNRLLISGPISDNCTAFTGSQGAMKPSKPGIDTLPTKWQDVNFLCDMGNFTRNVVGVGTDDSGVQVPLMSSNGSRHAFMFVYTDHNANPDYQILEKALTSFTLK